MPLGYYFEVISNGKGTMLPYAAQIPEADRWAIAVWVRALQLHGKNKGWKDDPAPAPIPTEGK
jgi:mono/diheme cytochrome c family protein